MLKSYVIMPALCSIHKTMNKLVIMLALYAQAYSWCASGSVWFVNFSTGDLKPWKLLSVDDSGILGRVSLDKMA